MYKKLLATILSVAMVLSMLPATALASTDTLSSNLGDYLNDGVYTIDKDTTIVLGENITVDAPIVIPAGKAVTLDLNGKTITYNSTTQGESMITNKGTLTINDSSDSDPGVINFNYTGAADSSYGIGNYTISNAGNLTVNGGKITIANLSGHAKYPINNNSTSGNAVLVVNGGHLYNYNTSAIRQFCNSTTYQNSVTINGGLIEGYCAIWMQNPGANTVNGKLTINGGEIKTTAKAWSGAGYGGTSALNEVGSTIYCTIDGTGGAWSESSFMKFIGGTFNENVELDEYTPAVTIGAKAFFNGKCTVTNSAVAQVGDAYYTSLAAAIDAAEAGDTVTLLANIDLPSGGVTVNKTVTVDLNGKTINATDDVFIVTGGKLTINDSVGTGVVNAGSNVVSNCVWANGGAVVINGGTWNGSKDSEGIGNDTIYTKNGGTVEINGGTFTAQPNTRDYAEAQNAILNKHGATGGAIVVKGGTFVNFNPADNVSENPKESFVADGYYVEQSGSNYIVKNVIAVTGVTLDKSTMSLTTGETGTLTAIVAPDTATNKAVTWTSSNTSVATVSNGTVTAVAYGTATITVTTENGGETASCTVTVSVPTYTITIDANGGTLSGDADAQTTNGRLTALPADPTRSGYTFDGWFTAASGGSAVTTDTVFEADSIVYAQWTVNQYTITFNADGGTVVAPITQNYNSAVSAPSAPTKVGHTFAGWDKTIPTTMPAENMTITAQWTPNEGTITFNTNGGTVIAPIIGNYGDPVNAPADPTKVGYTFAGWDKEIPETIPAEGMTITALWTIDQYTITFNVNGGSAVEPQSVNHNGLVSEPEDPTLQNKEFMGWYTDEALTIAFDFNTPITATTTLYARWENFVIFEAAGGTFWWGAPFHSFVVPTGMTVREAMDAAVAGGEIALSDPSRPGYDWGCYWYNSDRTGSFDFNATLTESTVAHAKWIPIEYTITYNLNGGTASNPATYTIESADITLVTPTRSGYTFAGWTGTDLSSATETVTIAAGSTGNREYTATWNAVYVPSYPSTPSVPSTPSTPSTSTETTENEDGSTTTTVTDNKTGTVTETTTNTDGSTTTVETQKDGTVTETVENTDGSTQVTETKAETTTNADGSTTTTTATKTESTDASGATVTETKTEETVTTETGSVTTSTTEVKSEDKTEVTETKAETTVNADGSTETKTESTTTATAADGTVTTSTTTATETTTVTDEGATVTEKVEETKTESADATVETKTTATTTATEEKTETVAVTEETVTKTDGTTETKTTTTTETALADGTTGTAVTDESGKTEAEVVISEEAAASETTVALPIPAVTSTTDSAAASTITVTTNSETDTTVSIPVAEGTGAGTVAVIVNADGTETVVTASKVTENGLEVSVPDGATIKVVDNSTSFTDVADTNWEKDAVDFTSARGIMQGTSTGENATFDSNTPTTRAMVWTMLARLSGVDTTPSEGESWWTIGQKWAMGNGISDGTNHDGEITREQLATMLYRYAGSPETDHDITHFDDHHETSDWALAAKEWAVANGVISGVGQADGSVTLEPKGNAIRSHVAQMFMNFMINVDT